MASVKLLICYHKKAPLFKDNILTPIHVGRALAKQKLDHTSENYTWLMDNLIGDDTGDNISDKNSYYNEMTAIYWAWKNYEELGNPDYIGLMHYRRHFILDPDALDVMNVRNFDPDTYYDILNYSEEKMERLVEGCDFLPHIGKVNNIYKHYTENQRYADIDLANEIILEKYPEYESTMKKYYAGNESNFCNMCIFKKELFFDYCEWIFSILEEFEKRVDMSEKRFFISERLTGLYIAHLMEDSALTYKKLPIAFIDEPTEIAAAFYLDEQTIQKTAMSILSVLSNADGYNSYHFYLFVRMMDEPTVERLIRWFTENYKKCQFDTIAFDKDQELLPLLIPSLLPKVGKCIYMSENTFATRDIGEFFRICSVDDYLAVGVPEMIYNPSEADKVIKDDLLVLNCNRMRQHQKAIEESIEESGESTSEVLNKALKNEIGYIPWYLFTSEALTIGKDQAFFENKKRSQFKLEISWRPFLLIDYSSPIENNQGVYAMFWWDLLSKLPLFMQKVSANEELLTYFYKKQQKEADFIKEGKYTYSGPLTVNNNIEPTVQGKWDAEPQQPVEEWRSYGFIGKLRFFYQHNGLKNTVKYAIKKVSGGNK